MGLTEPMKIELREISDFITVEPSTNKVREMVHVKIRYIEILLKKNSKHFVCHVPCLRNIFSSTSFKSIKYFQSNSHK